MDRPDATCWQCGAPARADCACKLVLVAPTARALDPLGFPVKRDGWRDKVRVAVPRCPECRNRALVMIIGAFSGMAVGAIVASILQAVVWPRLEAPSWIRVYHEGIGTTATGIGAVLGFVVALLGFSLRRRTSGLRSLNTYPPIRMLRRAGWQYPMD